jgi:hypothetical protein
MKLKTYLSALLLFMAAVSCTVSKTTSIHQETASKPSQPDARISLNINEAVYFKFIKQGDAWHGNLTTYTLNEEGDKEVKYRLVSAPDSSWNDFGAFVSFLKIFDLPPQNEIDGWVPNSAQLPKRVYNFEVFDGDTTRRFSYQDPMADIQNYWQAQNVLTFTTFIQNDLQWVKKPE